MLDVTFHILLLKYPTFHVLLNKYSEEIKTYKLFLVLAVGDPNEMLARTALSIDFQLFQRLSFHCPTADITGG